MIHIFLIENGPLGISFDNGLRVTEVHPFIEIDGMAVQNKTPIQVGDVLLSMNDENLALHLQQGGIIAVTALFAAYSNNERMVEVKRIDTRTKLKKKEKKKEKKKSQSSLSSSMSIESMMSDPMSISEGEGKQAAGSTASVVAKKKKKKKKKPSAPVVMPTKKPSSSTTSLSTKTNVSKKKGILRSTSRFSSTTPPPSTNNSILRSSSYEAPVKSISVKSKSILRASSFSPLPWEDDEGTRTASVSAAVGKKSAAVGKKKKKKKKKEKSQEGPVSSVTTRPRSDSDISSVQSDISDKDYSTQVDDEVRNGISFVIRIAYPHGNGCKQRNIGTFHTLAKAAISNETAVLLLEPTRSLPVPLLEEQYKQKFEEVKKQAKQAAENGAVPPNLRVTNSTSYTKGINYQRQNVNIEVKVKDVKMEEGNKTKYIGAFSNVSEAIIARDASNDYYASRDAKIPWKDALTHAKQCAKRAIGSMSVSSGSQSYARSFLSIASNQTKSMQSLSNDDRSNSSMSTASTSRRMRVVNARPLLKDAGSGEKDTWCREIEQVFLEYKQNNTNSISGEIEPLKGNARIIVRDKVQLIAEKQKPQYLDKLKKEKGDEEYQKWWHNQMLSNMTSDFLACKERPCCFVQDCNNSTWNNREMLLCSECTVKTHKITNFNQTVNHRQVRICGFTRDGVQHSVAVTKIIDTALWRSEGVHFPFELSIVPQEYWESPEVYDCAVELLQQARNKHRDSRTKRDTARIEERAAHRRAATELALEIYNINKRGEVISPRKWFFMCMNAKNETSFNEISSEPGSRLNHVTVVDPDVELVTQNPKKAAHQGEDVEVDQVNVLLPNTMLELAVVADLLPHLTIAELVDEWIWMGGEGVVAAFQFFFRHYPWVYQATPGEEYFVKTVYSTNTMYDRCRQFCMSGSSDDRHSGVAMIRHKQLVCFKPRVDANKPHLQYDLCTKVEVTDSKNPMEWNYTIVRVRDKGTRKMKEGEWSFEDKNIVADITGIYYQPEVIELE